MGEKRCNVCHLMLPRSEFNRTASNKDGLDRRCRSCAAAWYQANKEVHKKNVRRRNDRVRAEHNGRLADYLRDHPCVDCGETDLRVLEFDHDDPAEKFGEVTRMISNSLPWRRIEAEIAKCTVRCANCHRRRTVEVGRFWRAAVERDRRAELVAVTTRRLELVLSAGRPSTGQLGLW